MGGGALAKPSDMHRINAVGKPKIGESSQYLLHSDAQFHSCKVDAEAHVCATSEGEVALRFAVDVEHVRVLPTLWIAVSNSDNKVHKCSGGNGNTLNFRVDNSCAAK
jgi:hypothetical protein